VVVERTLNLGAIRVCIDLQVVRGVDALDDDHAVVLGLDLTDDLADQSTFACRDLTRFQRASKRSRQSAACGGDDVVESGRALGFCSRRDAVVFRDAGVDAEHHGLGLGRDVGAAQRPTNSFNANVGCVNRLTHVAIVFEAHAMRRHENEQ